MKNSNNFIKKYEALKNTKFVKTLTPKGFLLFNIYVLVLLVYLFASLFSFINASVFGHETRTLTLNDFTPINVEITADMSAIATTNDPQLIYNGDASEVQSIAYTLTSGGSGVVCAYYTTQIGADFSNHMRLFPAFGEVQNVQYMLPWQNVTALRLDIGSVASENFEFEQITLNPKLPFWVYFTPSAFQIVLCIVLPLLVYAIVLYFVDVLMLFKAKAKKER